MSEFAQYACFDGNTGIYMANPGSQFIRAFPGMLASVHFNAPGVAGHAFTLHDSDTGPDNPIFTAQRGVGAAAVQMIMNVKLKRGLYLERAGPGVSLITVVLR